MPPKKANVWAWGPAAYVSAFHLLVGCVTFFSIVFGYAYDVKAAKDELASLKKDVKVISDNVIDLRARFESTIKK